MTPWGRYMDRALLITTSLVITLSSCSLGPEPDPFRYVGDQFCRGAECPSDIQINTSRRTNDAAANADTGTNAGDISNIADAEQASDGDSSATSTDDTAQRPSADINDTPED